MYRPAFSVLAASALALLGCDGLVQVEGNVVAVSDEPVVEDCVAELYLAADDRQLSQRPFDPSDLFVTFTVLPRQRDYYVDVRCPGYTTFRSEVFSSGGRVHEPHELGTIRLVPVPER